ncbi:Cof-type HAD-IIB family hydrolase [Pediococcus parvulus]|uniref:Cof-type HAD-IIB family hydrolase n=1 Tax=Pediococcus parvulus TaxID=54062 RepID=UPI00070B5C94|nr:Cof-type HAD-IIB family hydrolase [Pediococcus parvulus]MCT3027996.1 Cof-type HAD-IIB family hydrolase [Pediococcus parvulus]
MYKLIVSDLDETLLGSDGKISQENIEAIKAASKKGVKFVPNTGRGFASVQVLLQKLSLYQEANEFVISYNGGAIVENQDNRVLQTNEMTYEEAKGVFEITSQYLHNDTHVYTLNQLYIYNPREEDLAYLKTRHVNYHIMENDDFSIFKDDKIMKVITMNPDQEVLRPVHDKVMDTFDNQLNASYSSGMYAEFNHLGTDKGTATLELADSLGIKKDEILALGDNSNDLPMLRKVGMPVVVANGTTEAKSLAKYVTKNNYQTGVAEAIEKFVL